MNMPPSSRQQTPPHLGDAIASDLAILLQQSRMRLPRYMAERADRSVGLGRIQQNAQAYHQFLVSRGQTQLAQRLAFVVQALMEITTPAATLLEELITRERFLQEEVMRVLSGLQPTMTVQQQQFQPQTQQPTQPQSIANLQGQELLNAVQSAPRAPVGTSPPAVPVTVQTVPTAPASAPTANGTPTVTPQQ